jgi:ABC-2 type transport system permease protein
MNPRTTAIRVGWKCGLIELRQSFTNGGELFSHFLWPVLLLIALFFLRDRSFGVSGFGLGALALPSMLGMNAAMG